MSKARKFGAEPTAFVEPLRVSIPMAAYLSGESLSRLREKIRAGELRTVKEGNKDLVHMTELRRYVGVTDPVNQPLGKRKSAAEVKTAEASP